MTAALLIAQLSTAPAPALLEMHRRNVHAPNTAAEEQVWQEIMGRKNGEKRG